ncbi:MAG: hypothetical protein IT229_01920 [Flavobacteriales bacterium]|nr:hypothetical protein [Flavobacteriales bacterium]
MRTAFFVALAVMAVRVGLFYNGRSLEGPEFMFVHLLAMSVIAFFAGHALLGEDRAATFPSLVKASFSGCAVYALMMGVFIWTYYNAIDVVEFPSKINERVAAVVAAGGNEAKARVELTSVFNPFSYASITFFGLLVAALGNALLFSAVHHKVLRRLR